MFARLFVAFALVFGSALTVFAQQPAIEQLAVDCVPARKNPVLYAFSDAKGDPRLYFRRVGATEWCYVEGTRIGANLRAILPQFEPDIEIEHFFTTIDNGQVTSRSPRISRSWVRIRCDAVVARGFELVLSNCAGENAELGSAIAAAYALQGDSNLEDVTPFTPER